MNQKIEEKNQFEVFCENELVFAVINIVLSLLLGQLSTTISLVISHSTSNQNTSFHDVTNITATETEDINNIKGNIPLSHDLGLQIATKMQICIFSVTVNWLT